ncbi:MULTISPECIES: GNAT family N-acetyltransferase [unclassified Mycobacterium]|uniref:GNAT family N-acetyltransferase n=1 Tax=unclassified Mycobacterium TaxID=2642494 RepID=UPI00074035F7|nr:MULTISPECIES: GNAT family N-acetyltransferase [unclassified Mycobacterium]KUH88785.1 acetyltransferase [Mycobacterium sp. GA-0227b]KUH91079.1 acetyltransferase [Mycobacterium sp. GA-1999]KUH95432.1 acetyltransferase [Mycobacterium sp. IS-1556]
MELRFHDSADEFLAIAEPVYRRDPIANTIELTVLRAALPDDALLLSLWQDSEILGVALQTPPYPLACNGIPAEHIDAVARDVADRCPDLTGVRGARHATTAFADAWSESTGRVAAVTLEERLYRLGTLQPPARVAGSARIAADPDRPVLADWVQSFFAETPGHPDTAGGVFVDAAMGRGDRFVLWDVDGTPVSMALLRSAAAGVSRIGPVFTPANRRAHGYGSAVTAAAAQGALNRGDAGVVLFTDLANPTSNAIYQKIGFEAVSDSARIDFRPLD